MSRAIRAAGGVVLKDGPDGEIMVAVAHRPKYDDWSLPKGKADDGEGPVETALREVLEETGLECRVVGPMGTTRHEDGAKPKSVSWFAMRALPSSPGFAPNDEIDELRWLTIGDALEVLDYENDRRLVAGDRLQALAGTGTLYLVRHGEAGSRKGWSDDDAQRPLTGRGRRQAQAIARTLSAAGIERVVSSPYVRCVQTIEPLCEATDAELEQSDALAEGPDTDAALGVVESLLGCNAVICSHGDVIPAVIDRMVRLGLSLGSDFKCAKGSIWEIEVEGGRYTKASYLPPSGMRDSG